jgi:hypothetical protein
MRWFQGEQGNLACHRFKHWRGENSISLVARNAEDLNKAKKQN